MKANRNIYNDVFYCRQINSDSRYNPYGSVTADHPNNKHPKLLCVMYICNIIAILTTSVFIANGETPIVETSHGKIKGKALKTLIENVKYFGFMGIPYAAPPVKDLRFLPPQPVKPWQDVLIATKEKPPCFQHNENVKKGQPLGAYGSEDCLYLDIFAPKPTENRRAVIVFLYNINFSNSFNKTKDYAPDFFIEENVVIAIISHRLSALGFLSLEDEIVPGNAGLKDIVEGLKWIKKNIEHFGGDPDKITLMGSQSGASAVDLLIHTNAQELFSSVILQSGSALSTSCLQEGARKRAFRLGEILKFSTSSASSLLKFLREESPSELIYREMHASPDDYYRENQKSVTSFGPIIETQPGGLITEYPEDSTKDINIPIMIGFNSREGIESAFQYLIEPRYISFVDKDFHFLMPMRLKFRLDPLKEYYYDAIEDIKQFYFQNDVITIKNIPDYITYAGDIIIAYNVDYTAKMYSTKSLNSVYYYYFDYSSELNDNKNDILKLSTVKEGTWGAATGDDLCYLFKCPGLKETYLKYADTPSEVRNVQQKMVRMWTNFAKYGNPTPENDDVLENLKWPPYNLDTKEYLHITKKIAVKSDLYKGRFQFWDQFIVKWEQRAVNLGAESNNKNETLSHEEL